MAIATAAIGVGYFVAAGSGVPVPEARQASRSTIDAAAAPNQPTEYRTVVLKVANMTCASCPIIVQRALEAVDGVREVEVSFRRKTAVARYDPARTDVATLVAATGAVGFPSTVMKAVE